MNILVILSSLLKIFIIIIPGVIFSRKNILNENQCEGISSIVLYLTWPCLIIDSLQMPFSVELLKNSGILILAMAATMVLAYLVSILLSRVIKAKLQTAYLITFMLLFSNTGFMGIPVCSTLYGSEGVFYGALMDSLGDIFVFTAGTFLMKKSSGETVKSHPKELLTPGLFSILIGIGLFLGDIKLPAALGESLSIIGSATTPLAMLIIGFKLGQMNLRQMLGDMRVYAVCAARLLIMPALVLGALLAVGAEMSILMKVIVLQTAMPVATCTVIFAAEYKSDTHFTSKGVLLTTLLSVLTIPIFAVLTELL